MPSEGVELIGRVAAGDREAFGRLYDLYAPLAYGMIKRILPTGGAADDVLQEVFWEIWRVAPRYEPARGSPEAWVLTRARSRAIDRLRSQRRRGEVSADPTQTAGREPARAEEGDPSGRVADRELVRGGLATLAPAQREVVELAYFGGLTHTEIAARLEQPLGTVKTRIRVALQKLRETLVERA